MCALVAGLMTWGCGSDSGDGGGSQEIRAGNFEGVFSAIALDFARLLADVAPSDDLFGLKQGNVGVCPGGGTGTWVDNGFGGGTLNLDECNFSGVVIDGSLTGLLRVVDNNLSANMLSGPVTLSGTDLNVTSLVVSAELPIADATTFWEARATTEDGEMLCAWSGGGECMDMFF